MIRRIAPIGLTIATLLASACSPQATMPPQSAANAPAAPSAPAPTAEAGTLTPAQQALVARAATLGATDLSTKAAPGGGFVLDGKLGGDQFALAFPGNWSGGEGLVYAHGYSTPGTPVAVSDDPITAKTGGGIMAMAYADGLASGHSAYVKDGLAVESGVKNTKRLRDLLIGLGASRVFAVGDSMGGGIVEALLEIYPGQFAGGLARCGVVDDWSRLLGRLYDMRAAYNVLTKDTPYALPGVQDVTRSALPTSPAPEGTPPQAYVWSQITKVITPVLALFDAAKQRPDGREARIIRQVAEIGGFEPDPGALAFPLMTAALGADDLASTTGGMAYGNIGKIYGGGSMTTAEAKALNAAIQRVSASPAALAYLKQWHEATGKVSDPLVTMHNKIDSLVPYAQEIGLAAKVKAAGTSAMVAQYGVPPFRAPLPIGGVEAYTHCGFSPEQQKAAWTALHQWVATGQRPAADAVK